ncbi:unnamed protein product [Spirodela intermedia]|uniref:Uncharacterized protein n=1 Tax=Spirodela intermedia TaxID=51605 RepID=A0A7I8J6D8_SPIIN|nr:unnamed protein product [Spirodela intermedia]CAA6665808.1 unnamed protein product [Spirodela intermedia]
MLGSASCGATSGTGRSSRGSPPEMQTELEEQPPQDGEDEESGAALSSPLLPAAARETRPANPFTRKNQGKKAKPLSDKQRAAIQERLDLLEKNLRPMPFTPAKAIDFGRHERLFRALGLWDFAHVDLTGPVRTDLLTQLIANYDHPARRSWVNGERIAVSRPCLARALGLQWKKDKAGTSENKDADHEFLSERNPSRLSWTSYACILPGEVMAATQLVKEGQAQKVEWSALIWTMVEKELAEAPVSGFCYYASHLQCLMRHQKPGIFEGEEQDAMEAPLAEEEDTNDDAVMNPGPVHDSPPVDTLTQGTNLCLALGGDEGFLKDENGECQATDEDQWLPGTKSIEGEHCLQRCNLNDVQSVGCEDMNRQEVGMGDEEHYVDDISTKFSNLERMTSTDLLQAMDTVNAPYTMPLQPMEPSSIELLVSRPDPLKSAELDSCMAGPSLFKTMSKREIDEIDDEDEGNDISHFPHHGNHPKKMRTDGPWDPMSLTIDKCMDEAQSWMEKAKILFSQREHEVTSAQMQIQYMNSLLQQKDHHIQLLEKTRLEDQQRRQMEICRFEHELGVMARIVQGYRKALMETRHAFSEYRKQFHRGMNNSTRTMMRVKAMLLPQRSWRGNVS